VAASDEVLKQFDKLAPIYKNFAKSEQSAFSFHTDPDNRSYTKLVDECKQLSKDAKLVHDELERIIRKELGQK
jgi:hypothetical protein